MLLADIRVWEHSPESSGAYVPGMMNWIIAEKETFY